MIMRNPVTIRIDNETRNDLKRMKEKYPALTSYDKAIVAALHIIRIAEDYKK